MTTKLIAGDCLTEIKKLETDSINLCYFNPPYGITGCSYDKPLNWVELWPELWRVVKKKGIIAIHCSQPFTFDLIGTQRKNLKYMWYWKKTGCSPTGFLAVKYQPMRIMEEICVFYKKAGTYNPQMVLRDIPYSKGNKKGEEYNKLKNGNIETRESEYYGNGLKKKPIIKKTHNHPTHLIEMKRRNHKFSTRPIELCDYFINTYTNENDAVLDLTCSDGQTMLSCKKLKRNYIGIDIDKKMIDLCKERLLKNEL